MKNKLPPMPFISEKFYPEPDELLESILDIRDTRTGKKLTLKEVMRRKREIDNENKSNM